MAFKSGIGLALCLVVAVPALAAVDGGPDDIVVTGERQPRKPLPPKIVHHYVRQISSSIEGQLTRFTGPVCPAVVGLPEEYGQVIVRRIRKVAADAEILLAREKCEPNLLVVVTPDADALMGQLRKKTPVAFLSVNENQIRDVFRSGPVHVWNLTQLENEDGHPAGEKYLVVKSASIINLPTQRVIFASAIVIEEQAMVGKTLGQIADYAAMRGLAGARPPGDGGGVDTVMTLFDADAAPPPGLTLVDRAYLKGLYGIRANASDVAQRTQISHEIVKASKQESARPPSRP